MNIPLIRWFGDRTITAKVLVAMLVAGLVTVAVGLSSLQRMGELKAAEDELYEANLVPITNLAEARGSIMTVRVGVLRHTIASDPAAMAEFEESIGKAQDEYEGFLAKYEEHAADPQAVVVYQKTWQAYNETLSNEFLPLSRANRKDEARAVIDAKMIPLADEMMPQFARNHRLQDRRRLSGCLPRAAPPMAPRGSPRSR